MTQEELKKLLHYDAKTGLFTWLPRTPEMFVDGDAQHSRERNCNCWNTRFAGKKAKYKDKDKGYIEIRLKGKLFKAHRLAFLYVLGRWPEKEVDHINMNRSDNSWENLREASKSQNKGNVRKYSNNTSGFKGVSYNKRKTKWEAKGCLNNKTIHLGHFDTPEKAHEAYRIWATQTFGEYARFE